MIISGYFIQNSTTLPTKHSVYCFVPLGILRKLFMLKSSDGLGPYQTCWQLSTLLNGKSLADPQSWTGIENVANLESDSTCLYISYDAQNVLLWILKASGVVEFQESIVEKKTLLAKQAKNLDTFFNKMAESFRSFGILPPELCEDRSFNCIEQTPDSSEEDNLAALRQRGREADPRPI